MTHLPPQDSLFAPRPIPAADKINASVPQAEREQTGKQYEAVEAFMADGQWHTLAQIAEITKAPEASGSARLRDMRLNGWTVIRRPIAKGSKINEYQALKSSGGRVA